MNKQNLKMLFDSNKNLLINFLLVLILILGFSIRIWNIDKNPAGFFADEASIGYNAYLISETGKDEYGKPYPLFFQSVGDYKNPVYIYSAVPVIKLLGLSVFSLRLTSVIYGTTTILILYLLLKLMFNNPQIALMSSFMLSISPWHIHFSRVGFELISSTFWFLVSLFFLYKSNSKLRYYPLAVLSLIIAFLSYTTIKIYLPLVLFVYFLINYRTANSLIKNRCFWLTNIVFVVGFSLLICPYLINGSLFSRWKQVVPKDYSINSIVKSYFNHFSSDFLFLKGDIDFPGQYITRHSVKGMGELYWYQAIFILWGIARFFFVKNNRKEVLFFILLILIYPAGTMFTDVKPQATRSSLGIVPFQVLTGLGIDYTLKVVKKRFIKFGLKLALFSIFFVFFVNFILLLNKYPLYSSDYWGWQFGYREAMQFFKRNESNYDDLVITHRYNTSEVLLSFYNVAYNCKKCRVSNNPIIINQERKQLFAIRKEDLEDAKRNYPLLKFKTIKIIYLPDQKTEELLMGYFNKS